MLRLLRMVEEKSQKRLEGQECVTNGQMYSQVYSQVTAMITLQINVHKNWKLQTLTV